jgi:hypothetical protein
MVLERAACLMSQIKKERSCKRLDNQRNDPNFIERIWTQAFAQVNYFIIT